MRLRQHDRETETLQQLTRHSNPGEAGTSSLLVVGDNVSYFFHLPAAGEVIIGRAQDADLLLDAPTASRRHARISITPHDIRVSDMESHNGTRVNGELVTLPRSLLSGDVITICNVSLVLHRQQATAGPRAVYDSPRLRQRLEEELERARSYHRPLAVAVFEFGDGELDRSAVAALLSTELRLIDFPAWGGSSRLLVVMPELVPSELLLAIDRLVAALQPLATHVRAGYALYPSDGSDGDTLINCARSAARAAAPSQIGAAIDLKIVHSVGGLQVIISDPAMKSVYELVERLASSDIPVLICGETGTGKELVARALHYWSQRKGHPLVNINSAALQDTLAEGQLFGYRKGAFTGAVTDRIGLLESAQGGTVFIDELGEMSLQVQAKLLRALDTRHIQPVGSSVERPIDVRIVAATNRDLEREISVGRFREDLYYRVNAGTIALPPLRTRQRELPIMARAFLQLECQRLGRSALTISDSAMELLLSSPWPGNIRQLKNEMEFLAAAVSGSVIEAHHLRDQMRGPRLTPTAVDGATPQKGSNLSRPPGFQSLEQEVRELERERISDALYKADGVVSAAAMALNMPLRTVYHKIRQYGINAKDTAQAGARK